MNTEIIAKLRKDGFVKVENIFTQEEIDKAKKIISEFSTYASDNLEGLHISKVDGEVFSLHVLGRFLEKELEFLYENESLTTLLEEIFESKVEIVTIEAFLKPAKSKGEVPIHQDDFYFYISDHKGVNVWISLDGATQEQGPVFYYEGSHRWGLCSHKMKSLGTYQFEDSDRLLKNEDSKVFVTTNPGDVLIHDVLTVHGSYKNNSSGPRRAITCVYKSIHTKIDDKRKNLHLKQKYLDILEHKGS